MTRIITALLVGLCCVSLLGCGGAVSSGSAATPAPVTATHAGKTATETAGAYISAWEAQDTGEIEQLLTPGARSAWAMGGGMGKWLADQRGRFGEPLAGQGRVLAVQQDGGTGTADVAVAYRCDDCAGAVLADWPPAGSTAASARLTLERGVNGLWLVSYLAGSEYLAVQVGPTRTVRAAATNTAYAASMAATRTIRGAHAGATTTARAAGAVATRTAQQASLNATATALWQQWFPQPAGTPQPTANK